MKPLFADLHSLTEDQRIAIIVEVVKRGKIPSFVVEADGKKGDRYIAKIRKFLPEVIIQRIPGPVDGTEAIKVSLPKPDRN